MLWVYFSDIVTTELKAFTITASCSDAIRKLRGRPKAHTTIRKDTVDKVGLVEKVLKSPCILICSPAGVKSGLLQTSLDILYCLRHYGKFPFGETLNPQRNLEKTPVNLGFAVQRFFFIKAQGLSSDLRDYYANIWYLIFFFFCACSN